MKKPEFMKSHKRMAWEVIVLVVPCLVVLGVGAYWAKIQKKQQHSRTGPWRAVVDSISTESVNPLEAWQGFDIKVVVKCHSEGDGSTIFSKPISNLDNLAGEVRMDFENSEKKRSLPVSTSYLSDRGFRKDPGPVLEHPGYVTSHPGEVHYLLDIDKARTAGDIRLRGKVFFWRFPETVTKSISLPAGLSWHRIKATKLSAIKSVPEEIDFKVPNFEPLRKELSKAKPRLLWIKQERVSPRISNGWGDLTVQMAFSTEGLSESSNPNYQWGDVHLADKQGRPVTVRDKLSGPFVFDLQPEYFPKSNSDKIKPLGFSAHLSLLNIPTSMGDLYFEGWISVEKSVPERFKILIRDRRKLGKPAKLRLLQAGQFGDIVRVSLQYSGETPIAKLMKATTGTQAIRGPGTL